MTGEGERFEALMGIVRRLRGPGGCPWDRAQTHASLRAYALEEAREVAVAAGGDDPAALCEELGDLLLQVLLHAAIAAEAGTFDLGAILQTLSQKLIRRHPHVFGDEALADPAAVKRRWAEIKAQERGHDGAQPSWLAVVPRTEAALAEAHALGERAAEVGFDWPDAEAALPKIREEVGELEDAHRAWARGGREPGPLRRALEEELGDLLLATASVARLLDCPAEVALLGANEKFRRRFGAMEERLGGHGNLAVVGPEAREQAWEAAKGDETGL